MTRVGTFVRRWAPAGGVERVALAIVRGLPQLDWVCYGHEFHTEVPNPTRLRAPPGGPAVKGAALLARSPLLVRRLRRRDGLDLLHVHDAVMLGYDVITVHGCFPAFARQCLSERYRRYHPRFHRERLIQRLVLEKGSGPVIAVSEGLRRELLDEYALEPERVHAVLNGVDVDHFHPDVERDWVRPRLGIPEDERVLLFVGNEFERKGLYDALDALAHLPEDVTVLVVGGADPAPVRERARAAGVEGRVRFAGFVPDAELPAHYAAADAFVFPTRYEPFGLVILEAMACGTPVVVGDVPGPDEFVDDGVHGRRVPPTDAAAIAEATAEVLDDAAAMGRAARKRAEALSWERTAKETRAVYESVLDA